MKTVEWGKWTEESGYYPLANERATPCLMVYAFDTEVSRLLVGHFAEADSVWTHEFDLAYLRIIFDRIRGQYPEQGVVVPERNDLSWLAGFPLCKDFYEFRNMTGRIAELVRESGRDAVDVFLFGQNFAVTDGSDELQQMSDLTECLAEHFRVKTEFSFAGVPLPNIHDFRIPGEEAEDYTLYVPQDNTIYHYRQLSLVE